MVGYYALPRREVNSQLQLRVRRHKEMRVKHGASEDEMVAFLNEADIMFPDCELYHQIVVVNGGHTLEVVIDIS
jgi:hypothetical protein